MRKTISGKEGAIISLNSLVYFLLAYSFVIFSVNLFSVFIGVSIGFNAELFYHGYVFSGAEWNNGSIFTVFFLGNCISLVYAVIFERLYKWRRKHSSNLKLFFLWAYFISISYFLGNFIVGTFFNYGIGAAMLALEIPFLLRLFFGLLSVAVLVGLGYRSKKHIAISANAYFAKITTSSMRVFFISQIIVPAMLGLAIVVLLKIPYLEEYNYLDILVLLPLFLLVGGMFVKIGHVRSIKFKHKKNRFRLSYKPIFVLILVLLVLKVGLITGLNF